MEKLLTAKEAAEVLGLNATTVARMMRSGEIESVPVSQKADGPRPRLRTTQSRLERWLVSRAMRYEPQIVCKPRQNKAVRRKADIPAGMEMGPDGRLRIAYRR